MMMKFIFILVSVTNQFDSILKDLKYIKNFIQQKEESEYLMLRWS